MLYRIQTENVNRDSIEKIVSHYFDGFTIIDAIGYWQGIRENSLIIEIACIHPSSDIEKIAFEIKIANKQQCVLISAIESDFRFI